MELELQYLLREAQGRSLWWPKVLAHTAPPPPLPVARSCQNHPTLSRAIIGVQQEILRIF